MEWLGSAVTRIPAIPLENAMPGLTRHHDDLPCLQRAGICPTLVSPTNRHGCGVDGTQSRIYRVQ